MSRIVGQSAGIHEPELTSVPLRAREMAVACRARFVAHDRAVFTDDAIEERRLADVRTANERDDGNVHASYPAGFRLAARR